MKKPNPIEATSIVEHKHEGLPRFVCIPLDKLSPWKLSATTIVEGTLNDVDMGRRSLKRWEDRGCWWIDLPGPLCQKAKVETGDKVKLKLRLASEELPRELLELISKDGTAKRVWERLTTAQQRMVREEVCAASQPATRARRARRALGVLIKTT